MYVVFLKYFINNNKILGADGPTAEDRHMGPRDECREKQIPLTINL